MLALPAAAGIGQTIVTLAALAAPMIVAPAFGRILLVAPLDASPDRLVRLARDADAAILGTGPFRGSLVIEGARAPWLAAMAREGIVPLAAPRALCGGKPGEAR
jgi:hypothetical protein